MVRRIITSSTTTAITMSRTGALRHGSTWSRRATASAHSGHPFDAFQSDALPRRVTTVSASLRCPTVRRISLGSAHVPKPRARRVGMSAATAASLALTGLFVLSAFAHEQPIYLDHDPQQTQAQHDRAWAVQDKKRPGGNGAGKTADNDNSMGVWFQDIADVDWSNFSDRITNFLIPEWSKMLPGFVRKLQYELESGPGSLADEIWREAHDPLIHPEVQYSARVRVSDDLCNEEKAFRANRKAKTAAALSNYLGLPPDERVHPDDVPVIALCGSGGGLRALVSGTGSLMAVEEAGLFDCVTYTAGVSGSCWLQALYFASFTHQDFHHVAQHLRSRLGVHIAHPPEALTLLTSAPTNKYLLSGAVERYKADPEAKFGLVDIYGTLLAARLLIPRGELGVSPLDFKISNQRRHLTQGQNPMPIYTAVRHEIPELDVPDVNDKEVSKTAKSQKPKQRDKKASEGAKEEARKESWFQWFEVTPYEFFCEEFSAGIPTWAMGRKFNRGQDMPLQPTASQPDGYRLPEVRMPLMLGIFGSAFCATLSHYYKEIRPLVQSIAGMSGLDELIWGRNDDLSKVHPIDPATIPNPIYGMNPAQLPDTVPPGLLRNENIQLMDAGMSNNLPLYPFMRPGRGVEVIIVFDASADIRNDNWLCVADGYARRRGVKGWPIGVGWPPADESPEKAAQELKDASAESAQDAADKVAQAAADQANRESSQGTPNEADRAQAVGKELGYCSVWVGSTEEKTSTAREAANLGPDATTNPCAANDSVPLAAPIDESTQWRLTAPDAGLTLVYLPYLANEKHVPGVNPATSEYMSTWNFIYEPEEIDKAVALAKANFAEGADQIRATVRAVYERKKQIRLQAEEQRKVDHYRHLVRLGMNDKLEGDLFNH